MKFWLGVAVVLAVLAGVTATVKYEYFFFAGYTVLMFIVLATAWNILGGYAGYVNFGTPAFFGLGAYTAAVIYKASAAPLVLQILAAAVMAGGLGFGAGILTLRRRVAFFAIGALASPMIGGTAHWLRPVIGATLLSSLQQIVTVTVSSEINVLIVGVVLVVFVVVAPDGILGLYRTLFRRR